MKDEIKVDGLSQFFWMAIPAVLAVAGLLWLSFYIGVHEERRTESQEARSNQAVGAAVLPSGKIQVILNNKRTACRVIDRASLDGGDLWVYWHKVCEDHPGNTRDTIKWTLQSPDGTVIGGTYAAEWDGVQTIAVGQKAEFHTDKIQTDPRVAAIVISAVWNDED